MLRQSNFALAISLIVFVFAELVAEFIDLWIVNNPTTTNFYAYERWVSDIPFFIIFGNFFLFLTGIYYHSEKNIVCIIISGIIVLTIGLVLFIIQKLFTLSIEYSPNNYYSFLSSPIALLYFIGFELIVAAVLVYVHRYMLADGKSSPETKFGL